MNNFTKQVVLVDESSETTIECYIVKENEVPDFLAKMVSRAPVFVGVETLFPMQKTNFFGLFPEEMPFQGKVIDTEELLFNLGAIGENNFFIVVYRIDFYNIEVKINENTIDRYTLNIKTNKWEKV